MVAIRDDQIGPVVVSPAKGLTVASVNETLVVKNLERCWKPPEAYVKIIVLFAALIVSGCTTTSPSADFTPPTTLPVYE